MNAAGRIAVVVLTHNRRAELLRTLGHLYAAGEAAAVCVVDNGSSDGSSDAVARRFPAARLIRLAGNHGAAGRNHGVRAVDTPYVAFCDDDTWWAPGALARAAELLDRQPRLAAVTARVLVGREEREDPTSTLMAASPLPNGLLQAGTTAVAGLLAGACAVRREAFLAAGGYEPRLFLGGEEQLLSLDLMAAGWHLAYAPQLVVHHHPSSRRDVGKRHRLLLRNALWCAWLRRPLASALRETLRRLRAAAHDPGLAHALGGALRGLPWVLRQRRVIPAHLEAQLQLLERQG
ncbi:MAG TPA: glycosyltransferase [Azonexus sp.]